MAQAAAPAFTPELHACEPIPHSERHGTVSGVARVWFSANLGLTTWYLGVVALLLGLSTAQALVAILIGNVLGSAAVGALSALGPVTGTPTIPLGRRVFGPRGNAVAAAFNAVSAIGWYGVNAVVGAQALAALLGIPYIPALGVLVILLTGVAWYGHDLVQALEHWAAFLLLGAFGVLAFRLAVVRSVTATVPHSHAGFGVFLTVVAIIASFVFSWAPYAGDYSRYLPADTPPRAAFWSAASGAFVACGLAQALGVAAARTLGATGTPAEILQAAMGPLALPALGVVVVGTVTANVLNVYTGTISALALGLRLPRTWMAVVFGVAGGAFAVVAAAGFAHNVEDFLLVISYWVAPWIGVLLAWSIVHPLLPVERPRVYRRLLWVFLAGVASTIPFMNQTLYVGPVARRLGGADIAYWEAFALAFACTWWILRNAAPPGAGRADADSAPHAPGCA